MVINRLPDLFFRRTLLAVLGLTIVGIGFNMWQSIITIPLVGAASIVVTFFGILTIAVAFLVRTRTAMNRIEPWALVFSLIAILGWTLTNLYFAPSYGTDEVAFEQYAATLLLHGGNPYGHDLSSALELFRVPIQYATYTMDGGISTQLAYPDLSFLFIVPFLKTPLAPQAAIVTNILFFLVAVVIGYFLLSKEYRLISPIIFAGIPVLFGYMVAGINSVIFMPLLMLAAYRWNRYGKNKLWTYVSPIAYGLACSVQQLPWFIAPFLITGIFLERKADGATTRQALRIIVRYAMLALMTFVIVNLPFIFWDPKAWLLGIFTPLIQHAIPYGQGIIDLSGFFGVGGGNVKLYTYGALLLIGSVFVLYVKKYHYMRYITFFLPAIILFFPARSLAEYFSNLIMAAVVGAFTIDGFDGKAKETRRWWVAIAFVPPLAVFITALLVPSPLVIQVTDFRTDGELRGVQNLQLSVYNRSSQTLEPHFAVNYIGQMTTFWLIDHGPKIIHPHEHATYSLSAPNFGSMSPVNSAFQVQAVTPNPETISISNTIIPQNMTTHITPSYVNQAVKFGSKVHFRVELLNHYGGHINKQGVPIALNQVIYGETALIPAESQINSGNIGETPVIAYTNKDGVADFTVTDHSDQGYPIYYEAWISVNGEYPYGYSRIVVVNWEK